MGGATPGRICAFGAHQFWRNRVPRDRFGPYLKQGDPPEMRRTTFAVALAVAVAVPVLPAGAKTKRPKPPTTATIKRLLTKAYCAPTKNARGEDVTSVKVTFNSIKRAKKRVGDFYTD